MSNEEKIAPQFCADVRLPPVNEAVEELVSLAVESNVVAILSVVSGFLKLEQSVARMSRDLSNKMNRNLSKEVEESSDHDQNLFLHILISFLRDHVEHHSVRRHVIRILTSQFVTNWEIPRVLAEREVEVIKTDSFHRVLIKTGENFQEVPPCVEKVAIEVLARFFEKVAEDAFKRGIADHLNNENPHVREGASQTLAQFAEKVKGNVVAGKVIDQLRRNYFVAGKVIRRRDVSMNRHAFLADFAY